MPAPLTFNLADFWGPLYDGVAGVDDFPFVAVGDSRINDESSVGNIPCGIARQLPIPTNRWSGRVLRGAGPGVPQNSAASFMVTSGTSAAGDVTPDGTTTVTGTPTGISPNRWTYAKYNANRADNSQVWNIDFVDLANHWGGDPFTGQPVYGRMLYYAENDGANGLMTSLDLQARRATVATGAKVAMTFTDKAANLYAADVDCGSGAGAPGLITFTTPGVDENSKAFVQTQCVFYRHSGGVRIPGFMLGYLGYGGATPAGLARTFGATNDIGAAYVTTARLARHLLLAYPGATHIRFMISTGQNASSAAETTELNAGTYTLFKGYNNSIVTQLKAACALNNVQCSFLFVNPEATGNSGTPGYTATNQLAKGQAFYELAQEHNGAFLDLYQLMPRPGTTVQKTWLADSAHPTGIAGSSTGQGADLIAANIVGPGYAACIAHRHLRSKQPYRTRSYR